MRARQVVEEPAYPPPSNDGVEAVIDIVLDRDCQLFGHSSRLLLYVFYTYSVWAVQLLHELLACGVWGQEL